MARPDPRQAAQAAALSSAMAGAVDLSGLKARAEARPPAGGAPGAGTPPSGALAAGGAPAGGGPAGAAPAGGGPAVVDVTEATFQAEVVDRSMQVPVLVDLWADWCQPCKQLSPVLEKLAAEANGAWRLAKVDVDANPQISQVFQVQSLPTVVVVALGQPATQFSGVQGETELRDWLTQLLEALRPQMPGIAEAEAAAAAAGGGTPVPAEPPVDPRFVAAEDALDAGDYDAAIVAYEQILASEPANTEAAAALAQVRFVARAEQTDPGEIARADAAPDDLDAQLSASDAEIASQRVEAAFDRLVRTVARTGGEDRDRVRQHLVGLFELFPADDPRVSAARRALARALF